MAYVDVDNTAGEREATEVLIDRGCRRIGTIAGPADMTAAEDRLAGWRQAMAAGRAAPTTRSSTATSPRTAASARPRR